MLLIGTRLIGLLESTIQQLVRIGVTRPTFEGTTDAITILVLIPPVRCPVTIGVLDGVRVRPDGDLMTVEQTIPIRIRVRRVRAIERISVILNPSSSVSVSCGSVECTFSSRKSCRPSLSESL